MNCILLADTPMSPYGGESEPESLSVYDQRVMNLQRQLDIESKVKAGADNMIIEYSSNHKNTDKKLLSEAQQMSQVKEVRYDQFGIFVS